MTRLGKVPLTSISGGLTGVPSARGKEARCEIGVVERPDGDRVYLKIGRETVMLTPDQAEELAVDLRSYALEVRNGGKLA